LSAIERSSEVAQLAQFLDRFNALARHVGLRVDRLAGNASAVVVRVTSCASKLVFSEPLGPSCLLLLGQLQAPLGVHDFGDPIEVIDVEQDGKAVISVLVHLNTVELEKVLCDRTSLIGARGEVVAPMWEDVPTPAWNGH
jgi:hypothetical protein